jgi:transposase
LPLETVLHHILFVLSEGCGWRAIHSDEASWNSVYQYWRRWCHDGVWKQLLNQWSPELVGELRFVDSTYIKIHQDGSNPAGGQDGQDMGKSKGGLNTKIHAVVDEDGRPAALILGPGNEADVSKAEEIVNGLEGGFTTLVGDKGYDSDPLRFWLSEQGVASCIPPRSNRVNPVEYSKKAYKKRHLVENFFERIKRYRRVATRYDKLSETFLGFVCLAAALT